MIDKFAVVSAETAILIDESNKSALEQQRALSEIAMAVEDRYTCWWYAKHVRFIIIIMEDINQIVDKEW